MPTFYIKLSLIFLRWKFSRVLFAYVIKEDVLLLLARKPWGMHRHDPMIHIRSFDAWSFTFGLPWSWNKNHRRLLSRGSAGTTSPTCYLEQRLLDVWAEWSKEQWRPKCERPSVEAATNTIKDLLKFAFVHSHFKHSCLFIYWIKCYGTLESYYCWFNSLHIWKVLVWYDQA